MVNRLTAACVVLLLLCVAGCSGTPTHPPSPVSPAPSSTTAPNGVRVERNLTYRTNHGTQPMDVYLPPQGKTTGRMPGIVFVHGGGWTGGRRTSLASSAEVAAQHGYLGFVIGYDLTKPTMAREIGDIVAAITDIRARAVTFRLDPARLAGLGASAGAQLIMQVAVAEHAPLYAVVGWSGPYDLTKPFLGPNVRRPQRDQLNRAIREVLNCGQDPATCGAAAAAMSPALRVTPQTPPVLLFNSAHELVAVGQLTEFAANLRARHIPVETHILPGKRHAEAYHASAIEPTLAFLDHYR